MPTSDEEVAAERQRVEKLRNQLAEARGVRVERENAQTNDIKAARLRAEAAGLEAELAEAREAAKVGNVRSGSAEIIDTAKEAEKAAEAASKAATAARKE